MSKIKIKKSQCKHVIQNSSIKQKKQLKKLKRIASGEQVLGVGAGDYLISFVALHFLNMYISLFDKNKI